MEKKVQPVVPRDARGRVLKGYSLNVYGGPKKGESLSEMVREALSAKAKGDITKLQMLIDILIDKASKGDLRAMELLLDRGYGKALERMEVKKEEVTLDWQDSVEENLEDEDNTRSGETATP